MSERGAGSVLAIAAMALVTLVAVVVLAATQIVTARSQAITAADAAALAAAPMTFPPVAGDRSPVDEASTLAEANGARLVSCVCSLVATFEPRQVEVTVAVSVDLPLLGMRWVHASSAAEFVP
ncbi:MAG TPA: Rv3654c family TadE-like protein [Acidimicrobiia bacterium]|nr:Rv3654c family TadE-like protein [Acidimicrobiia bacterium]